MRRFTQRVTRWRLQLVGGALFGGVLLTLAVAQAGDMMGGTSYAPVAVHESFKDIMARMVAEKPAIMARQMDLLEQRYDLSDMPAMGVTMSKGKAIQKGVRVKLPAGMTWQKLAEMSPKEICEKGLWPKGFLPLPHPNHAEGRHGLPAVSHRRDSQADRRRSNALRSGL